VTLSGSIRAGALAVALGGLLGCTAYPTYKPAPVNCSVETLYDFETIDVFDTPSTLSSPMWTAPDCTVGSVMSAFEAALPDGDRCGSTAAMEIKASHDNDWGSLAGYSNFGPRDGSRYEGISFWARVGTNSAKAFSLSFDDPNTNTLPKANPPIGNCTVYPTVNSGIDAGADAGVDAGVDGGACAAAPTTTIVDPSTGMVLSSGVLTAPPLPDACLNSYALVMLVTNDWQLYTIPFGQFQQSAMPNRVPNAVLTETGSAPGTTLITSQLLNFGVRFPKAVDMDLWIDNLAFYRHKGWAPPGRDGGLDGP